MKAKLSDDLQLNPFEFIMVGKSYDNIADIMRFCGVPESQVDSEVRFFDGGDVYEFTDANGITVCIGDDIDVRPGDVLIKKECGVNVVEGRVFEFFFTRMPLAQECSL